MDPLVSVIVLHYKGKHFLDACFRSILSQDYSNFEVILVDNGAVDDGAEIVQKSFPTVRVIRLEQNEGFAGGNNRGVREAKGELIVLLNDDTKVAPGWLTALVQAVEPDDVALASSLVITEGVPKEYYVRNGTLNFVGHNIMLAFNNPNDIFYATGCSLIFKRNLLGQPFDEEYFLYSEDAWLGFRTRFLGYRIVHTNDSVVEHFGSATTKQLQSALMTFYQERNRILNSLIFFDVWTRIRWYPYFVSNAVAKLLASMIKRRLSFRGLIKAYVWLLFHPRVIARKRKRLRNEKVLSDGDVIRYMSGRVTSGTSLPARFANFLSLSYCRLVGLRPIEFTSEQYRGKPTES